MGRRVMDAHRVNKWWARPGTVLLSPVILSLLIIWACSDTELLTSAKSQIALSADKASIQIEYASGDSASSVTQNLGLPTTGASGTTVSWSSDNPSIISMVGVVIRQASTTVVTLTATLVKESVSDTLTFALTVVGRGAVATPTITPNGGAVTNTDNIEISCATPGAKIVYTTDGTIPTEKSGSITQGTQYADPFTLSVGTATVKAIAFKSYMSDSTVASASFTATPTIYTAGVYTKTSPSWPVACYWMNGVKKDLAVGAIATSIFISNGTIYTGGYESDSENWIACYWVNRAPKTLPGTNNAKVFSIIISDGTVYTAGTYNDETVACYWVNDTKVDLPGSIANATSIFVSNGMVYTAGSYNTETAACYWVNGTKNDLPGSNAKATSIFISDGTIYIAGSYNAETVACYWVNGTKIDLPGSNAKATSIFVSNGTAYVAGSYNSGTVACYWVNGTKIDLPGSNANATSIFVSGETVYIAGSDYMVACYWVNGAKTELPGFYAEALSIFVQ